MNNLIKVALGILILTLLVIASGYAYYHSDGAMKIREKENRRDSCYADVQDRYTSYLKMNSKQQQDGSFDVSTTEKEFISAIRKEGYRSCSELFRVE